MQSMPLVTRDPTVRRLFSSRKKILRFFKFFLALKVPRDIDTILAKLKVDIELARNQTGTPGMAVAIMHKGKLIFAEGFGKRNQKDPFTPEVINVPIDMIGLQETRKLLPWN